MAPHWPLAGEGFCGTSPFPGSLPWFPLLSAVSPLQCLVPGASSLGTCVPVPVPFSSLFLRAGARWSTHGGVQTPGRGGPGSQAGVLSSLSPPPQQHSNASQSLCDIIRLSREQVIQVQDSSEPDQLLATLEKWVCGQRPGPRRDAGLGTWVPALDPDPSAPGRRRSSSS